MLSTEHDKGCQQDAEVEMLWERDVARVGSIDALAEMRNAIEVSRMH